MKKSSTMLFSLLVVCAMLLSACGAPATTDETAAESSTGNTEEVASDESERGTLRIWNELTWGGTENLDPVESARFYPVITMIYDRLAIRGDDGRPVPWLATSWESNEGADSWTFQLRDDVTFHDGAPMTAEDVVYSMDHWRTSETSTVMTTLALIDSVEAADEYTVVVNLSQPHADFPLLLLDYRARIIPKDGMPAILETGNGTGPFKLEKLDVEGTTVLVANDDYWAGAPGVARAEVLTIPDSEARVQALLAGQIDWMDVTSQQAQLFEGNDGYTVTEIPTGDWRALVMRTDTEPFDNANVRKALRLAADRQAMVDLILDGYGTVACDTPVMPSDQYRFETDCGQNVELAKELLAEAGYPDGIDITVYTADVYPSSIPLTEVYQQQAAEAGINVEIKQVPTDGYWTDTWMVEPFSMTGWGERPADQILNEAYRSGGNWNETYWNSEDYDTLLDAAREELDFDARREHYLAAQELLWEEGGAFIPYHLNQLRIVRACVTGIPDVNYLNISWHEVSKDASCD